MKSLEDLILSAPRTFAITALCLATSLTPVRKESFCRVTGCNVHTKHSSLLHPKINGPTADITPGARGASATGATEQWTIREFTMALLIEGKKL